jgi:NAD(P)H-quinone oxidoreductase subunit 5
MVVAVPVALAIVFALQSMMGNHAWPWWWSAVLALAWAPILWLPKVQPGRAGVVFVRLTTALATAAFLTLAIGIMDRTPIGVGSEPLNAAGIVALIGMSAMYLGMTVFQLWPQSVVTARRWVYAGFYMDEGYTHWVLKLWPVRWASPGSETAQTPWSVHESAWRSSES